MSVRVLIDTTYELRGPTGTGVYVRRLIEALRTAGVDVAEAANPRRRTPSGGGPGGLRNLVVDQRWTEVELPRWARRMGADLVHHPLPALARRSPCPQVVTVHDLAFLVCPEHFDRRFRLWAGRSHRRAVCGADAVICVSAATAADVRRCWGVSEARLTVARHGPGQALAGQAASLGQGRPDPRHFLYVGDDEPRKNLDLLLEAYARYRQRNRAPLGLVLAGNLRRRPAGVVVVARPDAPRLADLFAGAAALVHPARHEGFGLTLLEAMSLGVPVVAASGAAVREVCADAVLYVDADDAEGLAGELDRLHAGAALRGELSERGRRRAQDFSWERSARAHIQAYTLALR